MLPYTARDATLAALIIAATVVAVIAETAIARRRDRRRRLLERREGTGRYATGCPPEITKTDLDKAIEEYVHALYHNQLGARLAMSLRRLEHLVGVPIKLRATPPPDDARSYHYEYERSYR